MNSFLLNSKLFDEKTFFQEFVSDLLSCKEEVIIESPFITTERMKLFRPVFLKLIKNNVKVYVITRSPREHEPEYEYQSESEIRYFEEIGVQPLLCIGKDHRKLAIFDRKILWEGRLNILSQTYSREIMRRIYSKEITKQMFDFLKLGKFIYDPGSH